ncbi:MAG: hypothetical protein JW797_04515 [Bradymonadales bacterium]|nr:hypothetical protein [Bradymonadales bacterium]
MPIRPLILAVLLAASTGCTPSSAQQPSEDHPALADVPQQDSAQTQSEQRPSAFDLAQQANYQPQVHLRSVDCIAIQPFSAVPEEQISTVSDVLQALYGVQIRLLEPVEHPASAWYEPRRRWRAERLLDFLETLLPEDCDRILGMTTQDISTTKGEHRDWGILGLANMPGPAAVISFFRCQRRVREVPPLERLRRLAVHEIGHTLGLPHCPTVGCFMEDAEGTVTTLDRETFLCNICRRRLESIP